MALYVNSTGRICCACGTVYKCAHIFSAYHEKKVQSYPSGFTLDHLWSKLKLRNIVVTQIK